MIKALLQKNDGLLSGRVWLRSVVKKMQLGLIDAGQAMTADGQFGAGTLAAVNTFQAGNGLETSDVVNKATWNALDSHLQTAVGADAQQVAQLLEAFDGDLDWVHEKEGHRGQPYWPGGVSGVTLDPGVDLGHAAANLIEQVYGSILTDSETNGLRPVFGIQGDAASAALQSSPAIQAIRISSDQALAIMPHAAQSDWDAIRGRFSALASEGTPPSAKTALLSLAYNRGAGNSGLEPLTGPLGSAQWDQAAQVIGSMQQDHELEGIRIRRRQEGQLIQAEVEFLASA